MSRFGDLLRKYRRQSTDPDKGGMLTQERLRELLGREPGNPRYTGAAISDWERGKSQIHKDDRLVLAGLIKVLHECGGISSLAEANELLTSGNYRPLDEDEMRRIFPEALLRESIKAEALRPEPFLPLLEKFLDLLIELKNDLLGTGSGTDHWSRRLLKVMGRVSDRLSSEKLLRILRWSITWLFTYWLTFPLLRWPFPDRMEALFAAIVYAGGATVLPLLIGLQTNTRYEEFWQQRGLANSATLRFFTHLCAAIGFHVGYMMVFALRLLGYYLELDWAPQWLSMPAILIAASWPVLSGFAAARQVPMDLFGAFGKLRFRDGSVFMIFILFGPIWAAFFYHVFPILLLPALGVLVIMLGLAGFAFLANWQRRRGLAYIPGYVWAAIFGTMGVLYLISRGVSAFGIIAYSAILGTLIVLLAQNGIRVTLPGGIGFFIITSLLLLSFEINREVGRAATLIALLIWLLRGRKHLSVPVSFWVVIMAVVGIGSLVKNGGFGQVQASVTLAILAMAIIWLQVRVLRHTRDID